MNESSFIFLFYLNKVLNYLNKVKASKECQRFWSYWKRARTVFIRQRLFNCICRPYTIQNL